VIAVLFQELNYNNYSPARMINAPWSDSPVAPGDAHRELFRFKNLGKQQPHLADNSLHTLIYYRMLIKCIDPTGHGTRATRAIEVDHVYYGFSWTKSKFTQFLSTTLAVSCTVTSDNE
jgi:hypothetical protein